MRQLCLLLERKAVERTALQIYLTVRAEIYYEAFASGANPREYRPTLAKKVYERARLESEPAARSEKPES